MRFKSSFFKDLSFKILVLRTFFYVLPASLLPLPAVSEADINAKTSRCASIAVFATRDFVVEKAEIIPAAPAPVPDGSGVIDGSGESLPEHCLVQGMLNPRIGQGGRKFGLGFDLRMPTKWNGRFAFHGGGGMDGRLAPALGDIFGSVRPSALARGFAVVSTDGGHRSDWLDGSFGLDQQARIDYAYNALDKVTLKAKELIEKYYGSTPSYSYLLGCSNGGRQGLMASQRFPLYFDGIVAGDPSIKFSRIAVDQMWNLQVAARIAPKDEKGRPIISRAFSDGDLRLVADSVLRHCDALDGLDDGLINDWQGCDYDPAVLTCKSGKTENCLSEEQVGALRDIYNGPRTSDGRSLYGPYNYDTGIADPIWRAMHFGSSGTGEWDAADATLGLSNMKYYQLTPPDPDLDPLDFDFDLDVERTRHTGAISDADSTFLETFARHGKMIVYNGLSDQGMASSVLAGWYDEAVRVNGESIRNSVRIFFIPGMCHCDGGQATDRFDMLEAIMAWVEEGRAPDRIIAAGSSFPGITRPLCPYPLVARYKGGDVNNADSFVCAE
ncbi:MAG: tannase/feruloyl esterase family alpha/beta hydrolase [Deltaproteobacteria bacterium]|nr:tannase/feruloyl esterase family alpha/beta hydrolase [Deltaproteobacteria bacterium]